MNERFVIYIIDSTHNDSGQLEWPRMQSIKNQNPVINEDPSAWVWSPQHDLLLSEEPYIKYFKKAKNEFQVQDLFLPEGPFASQLSCTLDSAWSVRVSRRHLRLYLALCQVTPTQNSWKTSQIKVQTATASSSCYDAVSANVMICVLQMGESVKMLSEKVKWA